MISATQTHDKKPSSESTVVRSWRRWSFYGDVWVRLLDWGVQRCPYFFEAPILFGYTCGIFLLAKKQRSAVMENLRVMFPSWSWGRRAVGAWRVFWEFAWMITDSAHARGGKKHVAWQIKGYEHFDRLRSTPGGALMLTAHMGNYDMAAPFFAPRLNKVMHSVRVPERTDELQRYMDEQRQQQMNEGFQIRYTRPGEFLGIELAQALAQGSIVAIQGDRVVPGVAPIATAWNDHEWELPLGPITLAQAARSPIYPVFLIRERWRAYRVTMTEPWFFSVDESRARASRADEKAALFAWWTQTLKRVLQENWSQWLVFEPAFGKKKGAPLSTSADEEVTAEPSDFGRAGGDFALAQLISSFFAVRDRVDEQRPLRPADEADPSFLECIITSAWTVMVLTWAVGWLMRDWPWWVMLITVPIGLFVVLHLVPMVISWIAEGLTDEEHKQRPIINNVCAAILVIIGLSSWWVCPLGYLIGGVTLSLLTLNLVAWVILFFQKKLSQVKRTI